MFISSYTDKILRFFTTWMTSIIVFHSVQNRWYHRSGSFFVVCNSSPTTMGDVGGTGSSATVDWIYCRLCPGVFLSPCPPVPGLHCPMAADAPLPRWDPGHMEPGVSQVLLILIGSGMTYCQGEGDCHGSAGTGGWRREECPRALVYQENKRGSALASHQIQQRRSRKQHLEWVSSAIVANAEYPEWIWGKSRNISSFLKDPWVQTCESAAERWTYLIQDSSFWPSDALEGQSCGLGCEELMNSVAVVTRS